MEERITRTRVRCDYIDMMKAVAIFCVVVYHSPEYNLQIISGSSVLLSLHYFFQMLLSLSVPVFFFVNGYLILNSQFDLRRHLTKTIRIVVLTFLWAIIILGCLRLIAKKPMELGEFLQYVWNFQEGWIHCLWFMGALVCVYIFVPVLKVAYDSNQKAFLYFTAVASILTFGNTAINYAVSFYQYFMSGSRVIYRENWFNMFNPFRGICGYAFAYFCIGGLAHRYKKRIERISPTVRNLAALEAMILCCVAHMFLDMQCTRMTDGQWDHVLHSFDLLPTIVMLLALFVLSLSYQKAWKPIRMISANTLGIYFVHSIVIGLLTMLTDAVQISFFIPKVLVGVLVLAISLGFTLLLRKVPLLESFVRI